MRIKGLSVAESTEELQVSLPLSRLEVCTSGSVISFRPEVLAAWGHRINGMMWDVSSNTMDVGMALSSPSMKPRPRLKLQYIGERHVTAMLLWRFSRPQA